jgi:hypothetical protein
VTVQRLRTGSERAVSRFQRRARRIGFIDRVSLAVAGNRPTGRSARGALSYLIPCAISKNQCRRRRCGRRDILEREASPRTVRERVQFSERPNDLGDTVRVAVGRRTARTRLVGTGSGDGPPAADPCICDARRVAVPGRWPPPGARQAPAGRARGRAPRVARIAPAVRASGSAASTRTGPSPLASPTGSRSYTSPAPEQETDDRHSSS